jgi:A/G-specific adenine glycosylase
VLVAEVLLQRSRGKTVAHVYEDLFDRWPGARELACASEEEILSVIRPVGLVSRATVLKSLAEETVRRRGVPSSPDELITLPGVGRYAANATAAIAFGQHVPTVDGVTARVYRRYFLLPAGREASSDSDLWALVERVTPHRAIREWNWAVLDLAATVCLPKIPKCDVCPLQRRCSWALSQSDVRGGS